MISWLQTNFQKHFRVVFIVLLVVLVVAFVFTIGNQGPMGGGKDERLAKLYFFDTPLNSEAKRQQFQNDAGLSAMLAGNMRPSQNLAYERATALYIANQHQLPGPNDTQLEQFLRSRPIFQGSNGQFDAQAYNMIVDQLQLGGRTTEADLRRVLEDDFRIEKVRAVLEGAGFAQESEILETLSQRLSKWSVLVANVNLNEFQPEIEITEEQLREHYDQFGFRYETPVRRSVKYAEIDATQFIDEVKPTEDELITYFESNIDRYQPEPETDAEGNVTDTESEPVTFEQARLAVRQDLRLEKAREIALERAHDLVIEIIDNELSLGSDGFNLVLNNLGIDLKTTPHFAANETPIGTTWGRNVVSQAFQLNEDRYYSEPIQVGNRALVLFYNDQIDSIIPEFETLVERIAADVRDEELRKARAAYAVELREKLVTAAEGEEVFGAAAEEAGLIVQSFSEFTLMEPAEGFDRRFLSTLLDMEANEVSDMIKAPQENLGSFLYVLAKDTPEVDTNDEQYAQVADSLNTAYARTSAQLYLQNLMLAEQIRVGLVAPQVQ